LFHYVNISVLLSGCGCSTSGPLWKFEYADNKDYSHWWCDIRIVHEVRSSQLRHITALSIHQINNFFLYNLYIYNSLLGTLFPLPRILFAMASDGLLFKFLSNINPTTKTPVISTVICGLFAGNIPKSLTLTIDLTITAFLYNF